MTAIVAVLIAATGAVVVGVRTGVGRARTAPGEIFIEGLFALLVVVMTYSIVAVIVAAA